MRNFSDRSKKRFHLWKKALLHFSLCFVMGFFTGFAPTTTTVSQFSAHPPSSKIKSLGLSNAKNQIFPPAAAPTTTASTSNINESDAEFRPPQQLIIITTTPSPDPLQEHFLSRLAQTLRLVPPPLLWIVVEARSKAPATEKRLRQSGIMYRHITYKENFTDAHADGYHQKNIALNHVERHRLNGIVHFASAFNIYTLQFFEEIRQVEGFGAWPVAMVSATRKRIIIEGPICSSSKVVGWQSKELSNGTLLPKAPIFSTESGKGILESRTADRINISGFAFNSTILWDPERWGRPSSIPDSSQDSIRFVLQVVLEDETKIRAVPADCSKVMMWHLHIPRHIPPEPKF